MANQNTPTTPTTPAKGTLAAVGSVTATQAIAALPKGNRSGKPTRAHYIAAAIKQCGVLGQPATAANIAGVLAAAGWQCGANTKVLTAVHSTLGTMVAPGGNRPKTANHNAANGTYSLV